MSFSTSSSPCSYRLDLFWVKTAAHCVTLLIPCTMWRSSSLKHCLCPLINKTRFSFYFFDPCLPAEQKFPSITAPAWDPSPFLLLISTKWRWVLCGILIRREKQLGLKPWEFEREKYLQEHKVKVFFFLLPEGFEGVAASIRTDVKKSNVQVRKNRMFINRALRCFVLFP